MTTTEKRALFPPKRRRRKYRKTAPPATAERGATPERIARALLRPHGDAKTLRKAKG